MASTWVHPGLLSDPCCLCVWVFLLVFFCPRFVSCLPNVRSGVSGISILDYPFYFLRRLQNRLTNTQSSPQELSVYKYIPVYPLLVQHFRKRCKVFMKDKYNIQLSSRTPCMQDVKDKPQHPLNYIKPVPPTESTLSVSYMVFVVKSYLKMHIKETNAHNIYIHMYMDQQIHTRGRPRCRNISKIHR